MHHGLPLPPHAMGRLCHHGFFPFCPSMRRTMAMGAVVARGHVHMRVGNTMWPPFSIFKRRCRSPSGRPTTFRVPHSYISPTFHSHKLCLPTGPLRLRRNPTLVPVWKASFSPGNRLVHQKHTKGLPCRMCKPSPNPHPFQRRFVGVTHPLTLMEGPNVSATVHWAYAYRGCL
jgi:hypothetical protein